MASNLNPTLNSPKSSSSSTSSDSESDSLLLTQPSLPLPGGKRASNLTEWESQSSKNDFLSDSKSAGKLLGQGRAAVVPPRRYTCQDCGMAFAKASALSEHVKGSHPAPPPPKTPIETDVVVSMDHQCDCLIANLRFNQ